MMLKYTHKSGGKVSKKDKLVNNNNNLFSLSCTSFLVLCSLPHVGYITIILF